MTRDPAGDTRLRRRADFESILRRSRRMTSAHFAAWAQPGARVRARLGIVAGRKAASRAVDRNRAKRLIREAFGVMFREAGAVDVIVQLRSDLRELDNAAVRDELWRLLEKVKVATPARDSATS